jgi:hypothetical protein
MEPSIYHDQGRRRREDRHPMLKRIRDVWIGISTILAAATTIFLAFGFEFKTPATWLDDNRRATQQAVDRVSKVEDDVREIKNMMIILSRDACSRMTRQQLLVTPQCDPYVRR